MDGFLLEKYMNIAIELCIVGANGTMGSAFAERARLVGLEGVYGLARGDENYEKALRFGSLFLLAMKQKDTLVWLSEHGKHLRAGSVVVSLAALLDVGLLERFVANDDVRICRVMTTTGIANRAETIAWTDDGKLTQDQLRDFEQTLGRLGDLRYVGQRNDKEIDQHTFRACVPGWMADMCDAQAKSLVEIFGFSFEDASSSVDDALQLLISQRQNGLEYKDIRNRVMSRGGITEAGVMARADELSNALYTGSTAARERASTLVRDLLANIKF